MSQTFHVEQLDDQTREYLQKVRQTRGEGMPGVYVPQTAWLPVGGFFLGIVIVGLVLIFTLPPNEDPTKLAMLQTAGVLVGGWMIVAAFRVWFTAGSAKNLGCFLYIDPDYVWEVTRSTVKATPLQGLTGASGTHHHDDGSYKNTSIDLALSGRVHTLTVQGQEAAERIAAFLNVVASTRSNFHPGSQPPPPAVLGAFARLIAERGHAPQQLGPDDLVVSEIPEPRREGRESSGLLNYALIAGFGALCFVALKPLNAGLRDDHLFDEMKQQGFQPAHCREYLIDPHNAKHRDEVRARLDKHYEDAGARLKGAAGTDPDLNAGLVDLLGTLKGLPQPYLTLRVTETTRGDFPGADRRTAAVQRRLSEAIPKVIGERLVALAEPPKDLPALIEVNYTLSRDDARNAKVDWTATVRKGPTDEGKTWKSSARGEWDGGGMANQLTTLTEATLGKLAGPANIAAPAAPAAPPVIPGFPRPPGT